jgi:Zn-dependent protease
MNVVLALVVAGVQVVLIKQGAITGGGSVSQIMTFAVISNFVLFFFNLIPAPPLDGGHVAHSFTPYRYRAQFDSFARFGPFIVLAIAAIPQLRVVFTTPAYWCTEQVYSLFGM